MVKFEAVRFSICLVGRLFYCGWVTSFGAKTQMIYALKGQYELYTTPKNRIKTENRAPLRGAKNEPKLTTPPDTFHGTLLKYQQAEGQNAIFS